MVFKRSSVKDRLKRLEEVMAKLREKENISLAEYEKDEDIQWMIERGIEIGSAAIFDIGNHILSGVHQTSVDEYEKILQKLREKRVISDSLYEKLKGLGGFRNVLVHGYLTINNSVVYEHYKKALESFPRFIGEIEAWLDKYDEK
jgi:uncharacterized protein YutE (UPF0331/DUF86 family)